MTQVLANQQRLQLTVDLIHAKQLAQTADSAARSTAESATQTASLQHRSTSRPAIEVTAHVPHRHCIDGCRCICHSRNAKTLLPMSRFLGILFIGYTGLPYITPKCDDWGCQSRAGIRTSIKYVFPSWLLARVFSLTLSLSTPTGPELNLRVTRIVSSNSLIFMLAKWDDAEGLKTLLSRGLASPYDVDVITGETALHVRQK